MTTTDIDTDAHKAILRAVCDPGSITQRQSGESLSLWQARAVQQFAAPYIAAAERARLRSLLPYNVNCCEGFTAAVADVLGEEDERWQLGEIRSTLAAWDLGHGPDWYGTDRTLADGIRGLLEIVARLAPDPRPEGPTGNPRPIRSKHGEWTLTGYDELGFACLDEQCPGCKSQALIISELGIAECLTCSWREGD